MAATGRAARHRSRGDPVTGGVGPVARARASLQALEVLDRISSPRREPVAAATWRRCAAGRAGGRWHPRSHPGAAAAWQEIGERLEWLLPPGQLREAEQATPNAFYTPADLATACWQILRGLGSEHGRVLEPGCGAGAFIAAAPAGVEATWVGVERDPVTARIAQLLHPSAQIINERLQNAALPAHSVDAVIGNVPFGETPVYDPTAPKDVAKSLHNYCIWRCGPDHAAGRRGCPDHLPVHDGRSRLVGAARDRRRGRPDWRDPAPRHALVPGGTEVVTDILVLRRRGGGDPPDDADWLRAVRLCDTDPAQQWQYEDFINQWFVRNPAWCSGEMRPDHAAQYGRTLRVDRPADAGSVKERTR